MSGRPTALDDLKAKKVIDAIASGNSRRCAAGLVGVDVRTLQRWTHKDEDFRRRVLDADAKAEKLVVDALFTLATGGERPHFEALKFWLKTRRARTWREIQSAQPKDDNADLSAVETEKLWAAVEAIRPKKETGT